MTIKRKNSPGVGTKANPDEEAESLGLFPGMLIGASLVGAAWALVHFFGPEPTPQLCPVTLKGESDVPPGATQVQVENYRGYPISTYYVDGRWLWGGGVTYKNGNADQTWHQVDRAAATKVMHDYVDQTLRSGEA